MYSKMTGRKTWRKTQKQIEGGKKEIHMQVYKHKDGQRVMKYRQAC